jgi:hypothetical protein
LGSIVLVNSVRVLGEGMGADHTVAAYGEYRIKRMILEIYDQMAEAIRSGTPYRSSFDPLGEE